MKYGFIKKHQCEFPVTKMCHVLNVSRGGYYSWLSRSVSARAIENQRLVEKIKAIHAASGGVYGSPRITDALLDENIIVSRPRVARLMKKNGIKAITQRRFKVTTNSDHNYSRSPNLLKQYFYVDKPQKIWVSDITYISTREGWLYLTVIIDLYNRQVVGWSMSNTLRASYATIMALEYACGAFKPSAGLIFHSDQGIQYACDDFREQLNNYHMIQSMSAKGNCYDPAWRDSC